MRANQQQAETLKELGYVTMYMTDMSGNRFGKEEDYYPTLVQISDWLRDVKGLHPAINCNGSGCWEYEIQEVPKGKALEYKGLFKSHNEALSAAIDKALTILKEPI